eukprot:916924-Alexandrium_andersonii.AAC.1
MSAQSYRSRRYLPPLAGETRQLASLSVRLWAGEFRGPWRCKKQQQNSLSCLFNTCVSGRPKT